MIIDPLPTWPVWPFIYSSKKSARACFISLLNLFSRVVGYLGEAGRQTGQGRSGHGTARQRRAATDTRTFHRLVARRPNSHKFAVAVAVAVFLVTFFGSHSKTISFSSAAVRSTHLQDNQPSFFYIRRYSLSWLNFGVSTSSSGG